MEEWQTKRAVPEPRLTTGFLDGIVPIVDSYELKVLPCPAFAAAVSVSLATAVDAFTCHLQMFTHIAVSVLHTGSLGFGFC